MSSALRTKIAGISARGPKVSRVCTPSSEAAAGFELYVWGEHGRSAAPAETSRPEAALRVALGELADNARSGRLAHSCDVHFGQAVGRVLAEAQRQIDG